MWIEIFRGGKQIDSNGNPHDGDKLIDAAVSSFNAEQYKPPLVLGHPEMDSPAYGWVNAVKAAVVNGIKTLLADVAPVEALKDWVNAGLYRNRSAAFYADGRLRHVGFLGGTPPAVKGLAPLPAFADGEAVVFEIESTKTEAGAKAPGKGATMKFSAFLEAINIFKKLGGKDEDIDMIAPTASAPAKANDPATGKTFTEADIEAAKAEAAEQARAAEQAKFAEAEKQRAAAARKDQIKAFCEAGVAAGKIAPAWVKAGIATFMEQLAAEQQAAIVFCEGAGKKTPAAWFTEFLDGLPKLIEFSEVATRDKDVGDDDGQKREQLVTTFMEQNPKASYKDAVLAVAKDHPQLFEAR